MRTLGAVLAGGKSARVGRDKASLLVPGERVTLGERAVAVVRACCDDVVALGHARGIPGDVARIADARVDIGPLGGLLALLESGRAERYLVLPVDMPFITEHELRALLDATGGAHATGADATAANPIAAVLEDQPLPLAIRASCADDVRRAVDAGERRFGVVVDGLRPVRIALTDRAVIRNLNTLADFDDSARRTPGR